MAAITLLNLLEIHIHNNLFLSISITVTLYDSGSTHKQTPIPKALVIIVINLFPFDPVVIEKKKNVFSLCRATTWYHFVCIATPSAGRTHKQAPIPKSSIVLVINLIEQCKFVWQLQRHSPGKK